MGFVRQKNSDGSQLPLEPYKEYLKAADIPDAGITFTIRQAQEELVPKYNSDELEKKMVVYFEEISKGMVLNVVNWKIIEQVTGETEVENWNGSQLSFYKTEVEVKGELMPTFRIKQKIGKLKEIREKKLINKKAKLSILFE
jgi:hypothetical protein